MSLAVQKSEETVKFVCLANTQVQNLLNRRKSNGNLMTTMNRKTPLPNEETTKSKFVSSIMKVRIPDITSRNRRQFGEVDQLHEDLYFSNGSLCSKKQFDRTVQLFCPLPWPQDYEQDVFFVTSTFSVQYSIVIKY